MVIMTFAYSSDRDSSKVYLRYPGSKALEFKMSGLFDLSGFTGANLSYKSFRDKNSAYRVGVNLQGNYKWDDGSHENFDFTVFTDTTTRDTTTYNIDKNTSYFLTSFVIQSIKYLSPMNGLSLSYGYGPIIGFSTAIDERKFRNIYSSDDYRYLNSRKNELKKYFGGLSTMIGVEWFFHKNISFHAEYHNSIIFGKRYESKKNNYIYSNGGKSNVTDEFSGSYVTISRKVWAGVSFYFK